MTSYTVTYTDTATVSEAFSKRAVIDEINHFVGLLSGAWDKTHTSNRIPLFSSILSVNRADAAAQDLVFVRPVNRTEIPMGLSYPSVRTEQVVNVDIRSCLTHAHTVRMLQEVRRIAWLYRKDLTTGFSRIVYLRDYDNSNKARNLYSFVADINLVKDKESIIT